MKINIVGISDRGIANKERLHLKVNTNTNLMYFVVFDNNFINIEKNLVSNLPKRAYWFHSKEVKAGDNVVLYTRPGNESTQSNQNGSDTHFIYWGLPNTIWNTANDCVVLFEINSWQTSKPGS